MSDWIDTLLLGGYNESDKKRPRMLEIHSLVLGLFLYSYLSFYHPLVSDSISIHLKIIKLRQRITF